jgi:CcmD family protein
VAAYAFVWAVLLVYVWTVWRRLMKVERDIQQLASRVADGAARR